VTIAFFVLTTKALLPFLLSYKGKDFHDG